MSGASLEIKGVALVRKNMRKATNKLLSGAEKGMRRAVGQLLNDCIMKNPTVPHKEGTLRRSGSRKVIVKSREIVGIVGFNTPYAARLHEHPQFHFTEPGSGGKYLETKLKNYRRDYFWLITRGAKL